MSKTYIEKFAEMLTEEERVALILRYGKNIREWPEQMSPEELTRVMLRGNASHFWSTHKNYQNVLKEIDTLEEEEYEADDDS